MSQKNSEGTTNAPTQKSATASETISALVLVRSRRRLPTEVRWNYFQSSSKWTESNQESKTKFSFYIRCRTLAGRSSLCLWKKPVGLFYKHLVTYAPNIWRTWYIICQFFITKLTVGEQKHLDQWEGSVFNFVLHIWIKLKLTSTKDDFLETSGSYH